MSPAQVKSLPLIVVGSINQDAFTFVQTHPRPGETVLALDTLVSLGGKGCNQAIAAARMGASVYFIGAVGTDAAGDFALAELASAGVDTREVARLTDAATGVAYITVDAHGENTIVVASGANAGVTPDAASAALGRLLDSLGDAVVLMQGELAPEVTVAVAAACGSERFVLNLAPVSVTDAATVASASPLIVNESEAIDLLGHPSDAAASDLSTRFGIDVVVTVGAEGAILSSGSSLSRQPSPVPAAVVDTTGAGDAFVGVLAASLCDGLTLGDAARRAVTAASHAVESAGTTPSYATATELEPLLAATPPAVTLG